MKKEVNTLEPEDSLLLIIDLQEKFKPVIEKWDEIVSNTAKLIYTFRILDLPIIITEQYPEGLGSSVAEIKNALGDEYKPIKKVEFDALSNPRIMLKVEEKDRKNLVITGIEAHVCILQTSLSALQRGYRVHLPWDAISARKESDIELAMRRLEQAGALTASTEMIIFQLLKSSKNPKFKEVQSVVK